MILGQLRMLARQAKNAPLYCCTTLPCIFTNIPPKVAGKCRVLHHAFVLGNSRSQFENYHDRVLSSSLGYRTQARFRCKWPVWYSRSASFLLVQTHIPPVSSVSLWVVLACRTSQGKTLKTARTSPEKLSCHGLRLVRGNFESLGLSKAMVSFIPACFTMRTFQISYYLEYSCKFRVLNRGEREEEEIC